VNADNRQTYVGPSGPQSTPAHGRLELPQQPVAWLRPVGPEPRLDRRPRATRPRVHRSRRERGPAADRLLRGPRPTVHPAVVGRFTIFDDYHASLPGPTYPNRDYLHCAQSGGRINNAFPTGPDGFTEPTIWEKLAAAGVSANHYASDLPFLALFGSRMTPFIRTIDDYYTQCANGTLPHVVMVDPSFFGAGQNDDHPLADIRAGQAFLRNVFKAFAESPQWERGAFIATYDEWGGWFDHVPPPHFPDDRANVDDLLDFSQAGFRVPTVLASPFARPGMVDDRTYDHTSILRFLEWRFLGAPPEGPGQDTDTWFLTRRDRYASNIGASLSRVPIDMELNFNVDVPIAAPSPACATTAGALSPMARSILEADDPAFDETLWREYLDRVKFPVKF
jgi:phospholipase C